MKRLTVALSLAAGLTSASPAGAQTLYTCGDGTVRSVQSIVENVITQPARKDPDSTDTTAPEAAVEKRATAYLVTVQLHDMSYTGRSPADAPWNLDPTRLATYESVLVCANDSQLVLDRRDGTDYRAKIVRAKRDTTPKRAVGTR